MQKLHVNQHITAVNFIGRIGWKEGGLGGRSKVVFLIVFSFLLSTSLLTGCTIKTPEVRGVVLDEKTNEPVKEAWIHCSMDVITTTPAGDVHNSHMISPPHLRTDDKGRFVIPAKKTKTMWGFGTEVKAFGASATTIDGRGGGIDLIKSFNTPKSDVTIYLKHVVETERDYFASLQALYSYCTSGRFHIEVPEKDLRCDGWELNYAIAKHERYLKKHPEAKTRDEVSHHSIAMEQLAHLYKQNGDYERALKTFMMV